MTVTTAGTTSNLKITPYRVVDRIYIGGQVAIGTNAGQTGPQGKSAVAIGVNTGQTTQGDSSVAIGAEAGAANQGQRSVAVGNGAGGITQGNSSVAVGSDAGGLTQGQSSVAVGLNAGYSYQGQSSVAIGTSAGQSNQGINAIAIGNLAGQTSQTAGSICLNASGGALNPEQAGLFIDPIRNDPTTSATNICYYSPSSKEVSYNSTNLFDIIYPFNSIYISPTSSAPTIPGIPAESWTGKGSEILGSATVYIFQRTI